MPKLVILGSSNAIPTAGHENTHLLIIGDERTVLVDCSGNPIVRLQQAGLDFHKLTDIILTHFHPDHVSGVPLLLMDLWLMGRKEPLNIHGLSHTLDRVEAMMQLYEWGDWPGFFPVSFCRLPEEEMATVLDGPEFRIYSSPVKHFVPTLGLRLELHNSGKAMTYSCDTEPCPQILRLAAGADVLIHEATGASNGHTSAEQAGEIASQAQVGQLYLIHYPTGPYASGDPVAEARRQYHGPVTLADDLMEFDLG
jgi:ribonuclease Z